MSEERVLTKEIAEQFLADEDSVDTGQFTAIEDAAAEIFSKHEHDLYLDSLSELSDAAAESLSKSEGSLYLGGLTSLSDVAAESLSKHKGGIDLSSLTSLSDPAAESLSKYQDVLGLDGLTCLSDKAAISLSRSQGPLSIDLEEVPEQVSMILRAHPSFQINESDLESWLLEELDFDWDNEGEAWLPEAIYDALLEAADKYTCRDTNSDYKWLVGDCYTPFSEGIKLVQQAGSREIHLCSLQDYNKTILVFFGSISQAQGRVTPIINSKD